MEIAGDLLRNVAWSYPEPSPEFAALRDHIAFYAAPFGTCLVDGERATPRSGGFYGGWITANIAGPFKADKAAASGDQAMPVTATSGSLPRPSAKI